jgi:hypothetical protein
VDRYGNYSLQEAQDAVAEAVSRARALSKDVELNLAELAKVVESLSERVAALEALSAK